MSSDVPEEKWDGYGDPKGKYPFAQLPGVTSCWLYGTGACCHDYHFDISAAIPSKPSAPACDSNEGKVSQDKKQVNCKACLELIHA